MTRDIFIHTAGKWRERGGGDAQVMMVGLGVRAASCEAQPETGEIHDRSAYNLMSVDLLIAGTQTQTL